MPQTPDNPLTAVDGKTIDQHLRALHDLQTAIARASSCGVNCTEQEQHRQYLTEQLTKLKSVYFPQGT